jgi:hypothetical protein
MHDTLIFWPIHTLDRNKANPFPLEVRTWCLPWENVSASEQREILSILAPEVLSPQAQTKEPKVGDEEATLSFESPDVRILKFRKYFVREIDFDINKYARRLGKDLRRLLPVNLYFEYFEDESGNPISKIELYRFKTGEPDPVIPFDPLSVINLGPSLVNSSPQQNDSNTIAHLLEIVQFLTSSTWYHSPPSLTFRTQDERTELEPLFPNAHQTTEVALAIRQLYASDALFNRALNCYSRICGNSKKVNWIEHVKKEFNRFLESSIVFPGVKGMCVRELLDVFLYGGGIAHAPDAVKQKRLQELIAAHHRANVIMAVQTSFRRVVDMARLVSPVLSQDYHSWLETGNCPKPSRMSIGELLSSKKEEIKNPDKKPTT